MQAHDIRVLLPQTKGPAPLITYSPTTTTAGNQGE